MTDLERVDELEAKLNGAKTVREVWSSDDAHFVAVRGGVYCSVHNIDLDALADALSNEADKTVAFARVLIKYTRQFLVEQEKK